MTQDQNLSRRGFLVRGLVLSAGVAVSGTARTLYAADLTPAARRAAGDYGPLIPDPNGLLDLPRGFHYQVVSRVGESLESGGGRVPDHFDGQFAFPGQGFDSVLVRNHEIWSDDPDRFGRVEAPKSHVYDPVARGGTTTLRVRPNGQLVEEYASLAGTFANCSGGHTPWNTWLSCEEELPDISEKAHGWVFEVDPYDNSLNADPTPLKGLGRYAHEAIAVDPRNGTLYLTEDNTDKGVLGQIYRFLPEKPLGGYGSLRAGGRLQAMRVPGVPDLSVVQEGGLRFGGVDWVDVPDPEATSTPTRMQDYKGGGVSHSQKLEGIWWDADEQVVYISSSFARKVDGAAAEHDGQIWRYDPQARTMELTLVFAPTSLEADQVLEQPDQICASPYGGLMLCEDSGGQSYVLTSNGKGDAFPFARNRQNIGTVDAPAYGEFSGVVFADNGRMLFLNCYEPGTTFAIWGPWLRT